MILTTVNLPPRRFWRGVPALLLAVVFLSGCGSLYNRTKTAKINDNAHSFDANAQTVQSVIEGEKTPVTPVSVSGQSNAVSIVVQPPSKPYTATTTVSASSNLAQSETQTSDFFDKNKLPLSIALAIGGVALLIIIFSVNSARRSSAAFNAAFTAADNTLALYLQHHTTSQETAGILHALKAEFHRHGP